MVKEFPIKASNGLLLIKDCDKVEAFSEFFTSVFLPRTSADLLNLNHEHRSGIVDFSPYAVFNALRGAKRFNSSGPDNIPPLFWVNLAGVLAFHISIIFILSYRHAIHSHDWKCALVLPLFKKGDVSSVSNYRPISLICTLS